MRTGPIVLVEDDVDDKDILKIILKELDIPNELVWFTYSRDAFHYLKNTQEQPFLILSDVNLPIQSGIEFKREIDADPILRNKSIPFVFFSTSVDQAAVNEAYTSMTIQGFFQKSPHYDDLKKTVQLIIQYWLVCRHPNSQ